MIVVIQCAANKKPGAGMLRRKDGTAIMFVAHPDRAPPRDQYEFARPDDLWEGETTWRDLLWRYNNRVASNPLGLLPAFQLYRHPVYRELYEAVGEDNLYILSAGWGLIKSSFLTPDYDITFSSSAESYKRRGQRDIFYDFCMLPKGEDQPLVFFGGKDYVPLFCGLAAHYHGRKIVVYKGERLRDVPGFSLQKYDTTTRTNWHYECARVYMRGDLHLSAA